MILNNVYRGHYLFIFSRYLFITFLFIFVYICVCLGGQVHAFHTVQLKVRGQFMEVCLWFCPVFSRDQTLVIRVSFRCLFPLSPRISFSHIQIIYRLQVSLGVSEFNDGFTLSKKAIEYCEVFIYKTDFE